MQFIEQSIADGLDDFLHIFSRRDGLVRDRDAIDELDQLGVRLGLGASVDDGGHEFSETFDGATAGRDV